MATILPIDPDSYTPLIDTHSHLFSEEFDEDIDEVIQRCREARIAKVLLPNLDETSITAMLSLCDRCPDLCLPMIGLHPSYVEQDFASRLDLVERALRAEPHRYIAIGEIGLDYYWTTEFKKEQNEALRSQLEWSAEYHLPVSLHAREAVLDTVAAIRDVGADDLKGVFHSFTGDRADLEAILALPHFMVGVNGVVTFKKSPLRDLFKELLPLDRIVIETDSPYLAPVPKRGKRNESSYLPYILDHLSGVYELSPEKLSQQIFVNSSKMFNLAKDLLP